jgi:ABC-type lipoprotein export system ATPase subunit/GNAT superfamily N-acetyltransferase
MLYSKKSNIFITDENGCCMVLAYQVEQQEVACHTVGRVVWHSHLKSIFFEDGTSKLDLPRSACVSLGDSVEIVDGEAWVRCKNGKVQILPTYLARERISIGGLDLEFVIKEITEAEEFHAYQALTQFHYRGQTLCGRTAKLIVRNFHPIYPQVVGYIELATPLYMNKARATVLNAPFHTADIAWDGWNGITIRRHIHLLVRIARCVVYPEFRGLGLGQILVKHAAEFARNRWQVAGLKPYFLEISADMLKFVPFAQKAGMVFIGETEGNLKRVAEDVAYAIKNKQRIDARNILKEDSSGIVDQQVARMNRAVELMEREGWELEELIARLEHLSTTSVLRDFHLFHHIVSLPKHTYLQGLTPETDMFIRQRIAQIAPQNQPPRPTLQLDAVSSPLILEDVSLTYQSHVRRTWQTHAIQQAFGVSPDNISHTVIQKLSLTVEAGQVLLITGPSGSGKTSLLHLLGERTFAGLAGSILWPDNYNPGIFNAIRSQKALIELMAGNDVQSALRLLGIVGLSDAFVYLKRFEELSNGQKYRAMLAQLIAGGYNVWLADEFCTNLDLLTAHVVADRLQKVARQLGAILIVASSQPEVFASSLRPDQVVHLTTAWEHHVVEGSKFLHTLPNKYTSAAPPILRVSPEYLPAIRRGRKTSTIRKGRLTLNQGLLLLVSKNDTEAVNVVGTRYTQVRNLTEADAVKDGFADLPELRTALQKHYPDLRETSWVTIVSFEKLGTWKTFS